MTAGREESDIAPCNAIRWLALGYSGARSTVHVQYIGLEKSSLKTGK